ncbi:hypothetical protein [Streptomyces sp. NPDC023588]
MRLPQECPELARVSALPHDPRHDAMRMWMLQVREDWYGIAG